MSSSPINTIARPTTRSRSKSAQQPTISNTNINQPLSNKRKATTSPTTITQEAKKPTANKMGTFTLDDIERIMEKQTNLIKTKIKSLGEELKLNFDGQIAKINVRIDTIQENVNTQLNEFRTDLEKCTEQLDMNDENNKRISLLNELKLNGIAHTNGENLKVIFISIAQLVGFDTSNPLHLPDLTRSFKRNQQSNEVTMLPLIIMKFVAKHIRNKFYGLYLARISKQPILTENIKLSQGGRILIGENLTMHNQTIFKEAIKLKRDKKLTKVSTIDGLVYVKYNSTDKQKCMKSQRELEVYVSTANIEIEADKLPKSNSFSMTTATNQQNEKGPQQQHEQQHQQLQHQLPQYELHQASLPNASTSTSTTNDISMNSDSTERN